MIRPTPAWPGTSSRRRPTAGLAAALLGSIVAARASGQAPNVTPSPLNTTPPAGPRMVEPAIPAPPLPSQGPLLVPMPIRADPGVKPRVIDLRPDFTGLVPDRPPGLPPEPTREEASRQVDAMLEAVHEAEGELSVVVGRSRLVQSKLPLTRIAVSNPSIADVELIDDRPDTRLLNIYGRSFGTTDLTLWDARNRPTTFLVRVSIDTRDMQSRLKQIFPGADVRIRQVGPQVILEGQVPDAKTMSEVLTLVSAELRGSQTPVGGGGGGFGAGGAGAGAGAGSGSGAGGMGGMSGGSGGMTGGMTGMSGAGGGSSGSGGSTSGATAGGASGVANYIINRVRVPGPRQVLLRVRIAELDRTAIRQIGVNWLDTRNNSILGSTIGGVGGISGSAGAAGALGQSAAVTPNTYVRPGSPTASIIKPIASSFGSSATAAATGNSQLFGIFNAGEFSLFINALRQNNLAKILAEPNLVTLDGQPARFLAGGQFPYPVPQSSSINGAGAVITIQFAPFGALLSFLPHILADDVIRLDVEPSFSELNFATGTSVNGTTVPGINQRSARTVVEMREGQTLAIAGLLQLQTQATTSRIPGLGDIPFLGNLFSTTSMNTVETELIVLVTPELVGPMEKCDVPEAPGDRVLQPTDFEFYFLNRIEGKTGKDARPTVSELDPLDVMKHFQSDNRYVVGPHGYLD